MSETIINGIDVSECPCKDDDKCLETPILNEYGDLIDFQDCEPQTLCPYRSKIKIQRLQEENKELKAEIKNNKTALQIELDAYNMECGNLLKENEELLDENKKYKQALEEIRDFINPTYFDCKNCKELKKPFTQQNCNGFKYEAILNRINEVLNDN